MNPIEMDLNDHLLRRKLQDQIDVAYATQDVKVMKEVAEMLAHSYVQARVATKWMAKDMSENLGNIPPSNTP